MPVPTIRWEGDLDGCVVMVDQTLLPVELKFIEVRTVHEMWEAIKVLRVRGAPAIGIAAAMGVVLGVRGSKASTWPEFEAELEEVCAYLGSSRPTAVNLFWALDRMKQKARQSSSKPVEQIKRILLDEAKLILDEDNRTCRAIGENGAALFGDEVRLLTHCNAGGLATGMYGTALAVMYVAHEQGKKLTVYADETRPLLQGSRITAWELMHEGIDVTVICDNMAAQVMREGRVDAVIVGADRIARNGDTANKIGTYGLSVLARAHGIPFYVAAPYSTFDLTISDGSQIPIEQRDPKEVTEGFGRRTAPEGVKVYNPAFDVTPAENITAIITEKGVIHRPTEEKILEMSDR